MYSMYFSAPAKKDIRKLPTKLKKNIINKITLLQTQESFLDIKKLKSYNNIYRLRVGDYRVIYQLENQKFIILIIKIAHRKEVYKNLTFL